MLSGLPNQLTLFRIAIIPVFVGLFFLRTGLGDWLACGLFALASITDFFDGYIARRTGQQSTFGRFLDPVADKLLVAAAILMMAGFGHIAGLALIPALIILCREFLVSALREYLSGLRTGLPVSQLAKWKTTVQMVALGVLIVGDSGPAGWPVREVGEILLWIAAVLTLITGYDYLRTGLRVILRPAADKVGSEPDGTAETDGRWRTE